MQYRSKPLREKEVAVTQRPLFFPAPLHVSRYFPFQDERTRVISALDFGGGLTHAKYDGGDVGPGSSENRPVAAPETIARADATTSDGE